MCGRFTLSVPPDVVAKLFELDRIAGLLPRYNIAPTQPVAIVRRDEAGGRVLELARWGLVPPGSRDLRVGAKMINARQETLFEKAAFRSAAVHRRCLVPADGFFEWKSADARAEEEAEAAAEASAKGKRTAKGAKPVKQPYKIGLRGGGLFAMAGVYERFTPPDGGELETVSIVTTGANALVAPIHDRMPVILRPEDFALWLDPTVKLREPLEAILRGRRAEEMELVPVSTRVNDVKNEDPSCVEVVSLEARAPAEPEAYAERQAPEASTPKGRGQLGFGF